VRRTPRGLVWVSRGGDDLNRIALKLKSKYLPTHSGAHRLIELFDWLVVGCFLFRGDERRLFSLIFVALHNQGR
jgi:hypothetical protein